MDEPPDIDRFDEITVVVIKLQWSLKPTKQLDAVGMVAHEGMDQPRRLVDEVAGSGNPIVFEIPGAALEADHYDGSAMLVCANHTGRLYPQNVAENVMASIEKKMADCGIGAERHPRTLLLRRADKRARYAVLLDHIRIGFRYVHDFVCRRRRSRHFCDARCCHGARLLMQLGRAVNSVPAP